MERLRLGVDLLDGAVAHHRPLLSGIEQRDQAELRVGAGGLADRVQEVLPGGRSRVRTALAEGLRLGGLHLTGLLRPVRPARLTVGGCEDLL